MSPSLFVWLLAVGSAYLLWDGIRFQRSKNEDSLRTFRNATSPRILRNFVLVQPIAMAMLLPSLVAGALFLADPGEANSPIRSIALMGAGYFMLTVALINLLLFRPPDRVTPQWLRKDNRDIGYAPPPPTLEDWFWFLLISTPLAVIGVAAEVVAVLSLLAK